ncbi:MAG: chain length determinant protein EpsF [Pseudomonadota bacterium]
MNLTQFLLILNARKWIILGVLALTVAVTTAVSLLLPKEYTATTTLIVDSKSKDPLTGQLLPSQLFPGYMATQIDVIKSAQVAQRVVRELKLADNPAVRQQFMEATKGKGTVEQWLAGVLLRKLEAEPSRESSIISVSFSGADPQFSAALANAFAKAYIETSLDLRLAPARQTAAWFDQQIVQLRQKVDEAQQKLTAYQREKGIVESEERLDVETRRMADLAGQMVAAQSVAYDATSRSGQSANLPEVNNSPVVQNLKVQIAQGEGKLAELGKRVGVNHPDYQRLLAEVASYKVQLAVELSTATRGVGATAGAARQRVSELSAAFERQKTRVLELKQQREEATLLARDLENAQRVYDSALQRYGQTRMEAQSTQTDIAVLNPAVPPTDPSKPRVILNILMSLFLGTLLGVGVGFMLELVDRRVRSGQDIVAALGIPVLAEVKKPSRLEAIVQRMVRRFRPAAA